MGEIVDNLKDNNHTLSKNQLLDYTIGIQLEKIEKTMKDNKGQVTLSTTGESAMANLVELLKIRKGE